MDSEFLISGTWIPDFNIYSGILESVSKIFPGFHYVGQKGLSGKERARKVTKGSEFLTAR